MRRQDKIVLADKFALFDDYWHPRVVGEANGQYVKLAKGKGELVWHAHPDEDEIFLVLRGRLTLELRDREVVLGPGEMYIVPAGVDHKPSATEETHIVLIEPKATTHTGEVQSEATVPIEEQDWI